MEEGVAVRAVYARYVGSVYYEQEHPIAFNAIAAACMTAFLGPSIWAIGHTVHQSLSGAFLQAATYSIVFCGLRAATIHRPRRQARFARWAVRHPLPEELADPATAAPFMVRDPLPRGRAWVAWIGWTLLAALLVSLIVGMLLTPFEAMNSGALSVAEDIAVPVLSLSGAVFLRLYWPPIRDWGRRREDDTPQ